MNKYAAGKVLVGFSHPVVAMYAASGGKVNLTAGRVLARGVSVDISVSTSGETEFFADNALAEQDGAAFESGSLKLTVDGLFADAEKFISGQPAAVEETFGEEKVSLHKHSAKAEAPYVAFGCVAKYRSGGRTIYTPYIFPKTKFKAAGFKAQTAERTTNYKTQDLEATLFREDTAEENWKWVGEDVTTEAEAIGILHKVCAVAEV